MSRMQLIDFPARRYTMEARYRLIEFLAQTGRRLAKDVYADQDHTCTAVVVLISDDEVPIVEFPEGTSWDDLNMACHALLAACSTQRKYATDSERDIPEAVEADWASRAIRRWLVDQKPFLEADQKPWECAMPHCKARFVTELGCKTHERTCSKKYCPECQLRYNSWCGQKGYRCKNGHRWGSSQVAQ